MHGRIQATEVFMFFGAIEDHLTVQNYNPGSVFKKISPSKINGVVYRKEKKRGKVWNSRKEKKKNCEFQMFVHSVQ